MKTGIFTLIIIALIAVPVSVNGQVENLLKKEKKEEKASATKTADEKINETVNKGMLNLKNRFLGKDKDTKKDDTPETVDQEQQELEGAESATDKSANEQVQRKRTGGGMGALSAIMGGGGGDVAHKDSYNFTGSIVMDMEVINEDDGSVEMVMEYTTYFNMKSNDVAIEIKPQSEDGAYQADMTMIYDTDNNTMFMLTAQGGQKMAMASDLDDMPEDMNNGNDYESSNPTYTKTGKTKTIAGYKCDGYTMQDGENTVEMWVTKDMKFNVGKKQMKKAGMPLYYDGPFEGGMIMEMEMYEDNIKKMRIVVTDVKSKISRSISLDGYTIMKMNMGGQK
ncbi:MAG: DUF4412 domain-containing protein [Bacteroidales bacterium]|nr:DUF4412 domain-containing protein [Bacteroidales bacterium]